MFRIILILTLFFSLSACVTPTKLGISQTEWQNYSPEERAKLKRGYYEVMRSKSAIEGVADGSRLHVRLAGGAVLMPPFAHGASYTPIEFDIASGDSETIKVTDTSGAQSIMMQVCYQNKTLFLDPSRFDPGKRIGSIQLHYSPIWDRGFTYQDVSSTGYVHLSHVNVTIRRFENSGQDQREN